MKKKKKRFSLKREYLESWKYIKKSKWFIYSAIILFVISFFIGFFVNPPNQVLVYLIEFIQALIEKTQGLSGTGLIGFIFLNNLLSSFFGMIFGIVLGIFPFFSIMMNGYVLGFVSSVSVAEEGILSLWRIFPHGIFELPALFLSLGMGLKLGSFIFQKKKNKAFREFLFNSLRVFFLVVIPLLIIAGIIEGLFISIGI